MISMERILHISKETFQSHDYLPYNKIDNNSKGPNRIIINSSEIIYNFFLSNNIPLYLSCTNNFLCKSENFQHIVDSIRIPQ